MDQARGVGGRWEDLRTDQVKGEACRSGCQQQQYGMSEKAKEAMTRFSHHLDMGVGEKKESRLAASFLD